MTEKGTPCQGVSCTHADHAVTAPDDVLTVAFPPAHSRCPDNPCPGVFPYCEALECVHGIECADGVPLCSECLRQSRDVAR